MSIVAICGIVVVWLVVDDVPTDQFSILKRLLLLVIFAVFTLSSLATTKVIPWTSTSFSEWKKPEVLGTIAYLFLGAVGFLAGVGPVLNAPDRSGDEIISILNRQFPDKPPILKDVGGLWGDLEPPCETIWNFSIVESGDRAAVVAKIVKSSAGSSDYKFVGSIIHASDDRLIVEGLEPASALGATAHFVYDATTQRLTWDDRARGSGGAEIYRRCD